MDKAADSIIGYKSPNSVVLCEDVFHHTLPLHSSSKSDRLEQQCYQALYYSLSQALFEQAPKVPESAREPCTTEILHQSQQVPPELCWTRQLSLTCVPSATTSPNTEGRKKALTTRTFLLLQEERAKQHSDSFLLYE